MHRLVMWGFAIALVPLSIAVVCEAAIVLRGYLSQNQRKESMPTTPNREV